ncbi:MAG TPA: IPT/TIG domain-containing protein [Solirubrobacteraceae bacterium]|nr:IPT/TIG domain-containing protein [Solirubrobacteraceae bacterium]
MSRAASPLAAAANATRALRATALLAPLLAAALLPGSAGASRLAPRGATRSTLPIVRQVSPRYGLPGATVSITGVNFAEATAVSFGLAGASFTLEPPTSITAIVPAGTGKVPVTVTTPAGSSPANGHAVFIYQPPPIVKRLYPRTGGDTAGGTSVLIHGRNFTGATAVHFGAAEATSFTGGASKIEAVAPAGAGVVGVTVTTPAGTGGGAAFRYLPVPILKRLFPTQGPAGGGTKVRIKGENLLGATAVDFGETSATSIVSKSKTTVIAISPPGSGTVDVTVVTPLGTTAVVPGDLFSYEPMLANLSLGASRNGLE